MLYQLLPSSFNDKGNIRKGFKKQTERGGEPPRPKKSPAQLGHAYYRPIYLNCKPEKNFIRL